jgi:hypothetical protein
MITTPTPHDRAIIDARPVNPHAWLNRAGALRRWAAKPLTNTTLKDTLLMLARLAIQKSRDTEQNRNQEF